MEADSETFTSTTKDPALPLECILCIHHPLEFKKNQAKVQALQDFGSEVNAITLAYTAKLGFKVRQTNVRAQKIDGSIFGMIEMILTSFQINNEFERSRFFENTFLVSNTSVEVILEMLFLTFSNIDMLFTEKEITLK